MERKEGPKALLVKLILERWKCFGGELGERYGQLALQQGDHMKRIEGYWV